MEVFKNVGRKGGGGGTSREQFSRVGKIAKNLRGNTISGYFSGKHGRNMRISPKTRGKRLSQKKVKLSENERSRAGESRGNMEKI